MLRDIGRGTAIFAAEGESLQQAQHDEDDRRGDADGFVAGEQADAKGRQAHDAHRHQKGVLAPDQIADPPEHQRAERADSKTRSEGGEREDETGGFIDPGEKHFADIGGDEAVEVEIIPFEDGAERRGENDLALALPRGLGRCAHVQCHVFPPRWRYPPCSPPYRLALPAQAPVRMAAAERVAIREGLQALHA